MAHEVETAWMGGGVAAWWDRQKEYVQEDLLTPEEAWNKGGINWEVELVPVEWQGEETDWSLVVRDKDDKALACVGPDYVPLQNWQLIEFIMAMTKAGNDLGVESAMSLKGGKVVAVCARRPEPMLIATEEHLQYITAANWHDGTRRALAYASNVRTVCANTLRFGIDSAPNVYKFRHTGNLEDRINEAREVLQLSFKYQERVGEIGNELALKPMSTTEFERFLKTALPIKSDDEQKQITTMMNTREGIRKVYNDTPDLQNIKGTPWGALQAVAAYSDHGRQFKSPDNRFVSMLTQDNINQRAYNILAKEYQVA